MGAGRAEPPDAPASKWLSHCTMRVLHEGTVHTLAKESVISSSCARRTCGGAGVIDCG